MYYFSGAYKARRYLGSYSLIPSIDIEWDTLKNYAPRRNSVNAEKDKEATFLNAHEILL